MAGMTASRPDGRAADELRPALRNLNSGLHAIAIDYTDAGRILTAGVDPRREGAALGD
jgi:hypothetical protein